MVTYTREILPDLLGWQEYRKVATTRAKYIGEPFQVVTREGTLTCPDGYLAVDSGGWPYPIAKDEFERIYVLNSR